MGPGARTPEELETLLEDAFVVRDAAALAALFEPGAVLATGDGRPEARGRGAIARAAAGGWAGGGTYVAAPRRVLQARTTALILGAGSLGVVRRGHDGHWRYAIAVLSLDLEAAATDGPRKEEP